MNIFKWWFQKSELSDLKIPVLGQQASAPPILAVCSEVLEINKAPVLQKQKGVLSLQLLSLLLIICMLYFIAPLYFLYLKKIALIFSYKIKNS